jgi:tetratricopeptide (TPR) repeat protein
MRLPLLQVGAFNTAGAGDAERAVQLHAEALEQRRLAPNETAEGTALALDPHYWWILADLPRARDAARTAVARFEAMGNPWQAVDVEWIAPFSEHLLGRPPALHEVQALQARAERLGHIGAISALRNLEAYLLAGHGHVRDAEQRSRQAMAFNRAVDNRWGYFAELTAGVYALRRGDIAQSLADLRAAIEIERPSYWHDVSSQLLLWALAQIKPDDAADLIRRTPARLPNPGRPNTMGAWVHLAIRIPTLVRLGRRDDAAALAPLSAAFDETGIVTLAGWVGFTSTVAGIAHACAQEWDAADAYFRRSLELAETLPVKAEQAIARIWLADMLLRRDRAGDRQRARTLLGEAQAVAASLGMTFVEQQAREMA